MASVNIHCPRCQSAQVYRHGQNPKGHDRFRCRDCHRVFQLTYTYEARKPGKIHEHARIYRLRSVAGSQILNFMS